MKKNNKYSISEFYVGELYLYKVFGNLLAGNTTKEGSEKIQSFSQTGAINFQQELINRYIDWESKREYQGFLTIFYRQGDKYTCLHDGITYELDGSNIIENLMPLTELLPKINAKSISTISIEQALELFDILFKKEKDESILYTRKEQTIKDFYVGDISLKERSLPENPDTKIQYFDLPQHIMLGKNSLEIQSFGISDYSSTVYRCLFLRDGVDLYNINNNQFYNPNEDSFSSIISFKDYTTEYDIENSKDYISIPKALRLFKKTLR